MIKRMEYETPEIEITSFKVDRKIMNAPDGPGDETQFVGLSDDVGDGGELGDLLKTLEQ